VHTAKPNVALIVFGVLAILAVLGGIVGLAVYVVSRLSGTGSSEPAPTAAVRAEVRELQRGADRTGGVLVIGEVYNTGSSAIGSLTARVVLYDARHVPISTAACAPPLGFLAAGEKLPCSFSFGFVRGSIATFEGAVDALPLTPQTRPVRLSIATGKMNPLGSGWSIEGTLRNDGGAAAHTIVVYASVAGADGKLAGAASATLGSPVAPGQTASFRVVIPDAIAPAKTFGLRVVGTE
jgi:hypothetical protein